MLHAIVDSLFVQECNPVEVEVAIKEVTDFQTESETYDWIVFLPQIDGTGSYGSYYGRIQGGKLKVRGIASRRRNKPRYVQRMQKEMLTCMASVSSVSNIAALEPAIRQMYRRYSDGLDSADLVDLVITRRIGRERYQKRCIPQAVKDAYRSYGINLVLGMDAAYLVRDEKELFVYPAFDPMRIDTGYYHRLIEKAWEEVSFVFKQIQMATRKRAVSSVISSGSSFSAHP